MRQKCIEKMWKVVVEGGKIPEGGLSSEGFESVVSKTSYRLRLTTLLKLFTQTFCPVLYLLKYSER
jgi:hypothetical protein